MKTNQVWPAAALFSLFLIASPAVGSDSPANLDPEEAFSRGFELLGAGRHAEARTYFMVVVAKVPDHSPTLWNLGLINAAIGEHAEALKYWLAYRRVAPDWNVQAKLVQTYQALGDVAARDRERQALYDLRAAAPRGSELAQLFSYVRERIRAGGQMIFAYEVFEPTGHRMIVYRFSVRESEEREAYALSLGSYRGAQEARWQITEPPPDRRIYHLDGYWPGGAHATYDFYKGMPSYETIRAVVIEVLEGRRRPISGVTPMR